MLVFAGSAALVIIIIAAFVVFSNPQNKSLQREKIYVESISLEYGGKKINDFVRISDMMPNSMVWFSYPDTKNTQNRDAYEKFLLIRLPKELGGSKNETSAFRAYSALDLGSHCLMKYWPHEGRKRIEDPCHVGVYRPQDGLMITSNPLLAGMFNGLPYLVLSSDSEGFLYAEPPVWSMEQNGIVGIGRTITPEYYKNEAQKDLKDYTEESGVALDVPVFLSDGAILTPGFAKNQFLYKKQSDITKIYSLNLNYCNCTEPGLSNYYGVQKWKLGDERINIDVSGPPENKERGFKFGFVRNGYQIEFSTYDTFDAAMSVFFDSFFEGKNYSMLEKIQ
jgi:hypothetical protein